MKLYTHSPSPNCIKVAAAAHYLGLSLEQVEMEPHSAALKSEEFLRKNPNGLLPTLEDGDYTLWESNAILIYLAQKSQHPQFLPQSAVEMWRWMSWGMCHWAPVLRTFMYEYMVQPLIHRQPTNTEAVARASKTFSSLAAILESHLQKNSYMLGDTLTLVDFSLGVYLVYHKMSHVPLGDFPGLLAWYESLERLPAWQAAMPTMEPPEPSGLPGQTR